MRVRVARPAAHARLCSKNSKRPSNSRRVLRFRRSCGSLKRSRSAAAQRCLLIKRVFLGQERSAPANLEFLAFFFSLSLLPNSGSFTTRDESCVKSLNSKTHPLQGHIGSMERVKDNFQTSLSRSLPLSNQAPKTTILGHI